MSGVFDMAAALQAQLDRLSEATDPDIIEMECKRSEGMVKLTGTVLDMSKHQLDIIKTMDGASTELSYKASAHMLGAGR